MIPAETSDLLDKYQSQYGALLGDFDPSTCIQSFDKMADAELYRSVPQEVDETWNALRKRFGDDGFEAFQKVTLLRLINDFNRRRSERQYAESVLACFRQCFSRIVKSIADPTFEFYRTTTDTLLKDLALCRLQLFPCGAQVVEPDSAFHRSMMFRGGVRQAARMASLLLDSGGHNHWYQIHTHMQDLHDFNPDGWDQCYMRIADMLRLNLNIRGMWGASWFYDPALQKISPRLSYLRAVPQANGARFFFSKVDIDSAALSKSETRKSAYENGDYVPKSYALIWPRREMIRWADNAK